MPKNTGKSADDFLLQAEHDKLRLERERIERAAREEVRQLHRMLELERERADLAEQTLDFALSIQHPPTKQPIPVRPSKANSAIPVLVASDWHVGESVDPRTVADRNTYDPDIARKRAVAFFQSSARLIELARSGVKIDTAVLAILGDIITGYIHEELEESNTLSPTEEVLFAIELIVSGIDYLLDKAQLKKLIIPCCFGNHGRTGKKRKVSTAARNSFEWLMYQFLGKLYATDKRVEVLISDGAHLYLDLHGHIIRFTHGDDIRYQGGVGGLSIPMRKAIDSWDHFQDCHYTVCGHWHQLLFGPDFVVNGSLIGYSAYALSVKARFEKPQQAFFLIDKDHGRTLSCPIRVEP